MDSARRDRCKRRAQTPRSRRHRACSGPRRRRIRDPAWCAPRNTRLLRTRRCRGVGSPDRRHIVQAGTTHPCSPAVRPRRRWPVATGRAGGLGAIAWTRAPMDALDRSHLRDARCANNDRLGVFRRQQTRATGCCCLHHAGTRCLSHGYRRTSQAAAQRGAGADGAGSNAPGGGTVG